MNIAPSLLLLLAVEFVDAGSLDTAVVARVGRFGITGRDLIESYTFGPAFVKLNKNPLRRHLEFMIYERLLAIQAEQAGFADAPFVRERVEALEEDLTVDQLYYDEILAKVKLSETEVERGIRKARTNLRLRWIYMEDSDRRDAIDALLAGGVPFDSLYLTQFDSSQGISRRSLEITQLEFERDNPELAERIAELGNQELSKPIQGPDGFYILRVDEIWQNPLITETDALILRDRATKIVRSIKADALAREYVRGKMKQANPVIRAEGLNILRAYLAERGLSRDTRLKWEIPATFMTEAGPVPIHQSQEFVHRALVTFGNQALTVADYLRWFDIRQFQLKTASLGSFNASVKATIWKIVQDRLLSQEARRRGLGLRDTVRSETKKWEAKLLYLAARSRLTKTLSVSDSAIEARYKAGKERYRDPSGAILDLKHALPYVRADLYHEQETAILLRTVQRLRNTIPVDVQEDLVRKISEMIGEEESPINVIFYKPGGTFPRVAFPTIDEEWERFER